MWGYVVSCDISWTSPVSEFHIFVCLIDHNTVTSEGRSLQCVHAITRLCERLLRRVLCVFGWNVPRSITLIDPNYTQ